MYVLLLGVWSYPAWGVEARVIKLIAKVGTSRYFIKRRLCPIWGEDYFLFMVQKARRRLDVLPSERAEGRDAGQNVCPC